MEKYITEHEINELLNNVKHLITPQLYQELSTKLKDVARKRSLTREKAIEIIKRSREKLS